MPGLSDAERQMRLNKIFEKGRQISREQDREFHSILADVMYVTTELQKRKISEPTVDAATKEDVDRAAHGILGRCVPRSETCRLSSGLGQTARSKVSERSR